MVRPWRIGGDASAQELQLEVYVDIYRYNIIYAKTDKDKTSLLYALVWSLGSWIVVISILIEISCTRNSNLLNLYRKLNKKFTG